MPQPVYVINPNSSVEVTERVAWAAREAWNGYAPKVIAETLHDGPPGIVTPEHIQQVIPLVGEFVRDHEAKASAFVIACFSDPGMFEARKITAKPVIGIGEQGLLAAKALGAGTGVVAITTAAKDRHYAYYEKIGLLDSICGERAIDLSPRDSGDEALAFDRIVAAAEALRDQDGAKVIVLGCAGMAKLRARIEAAVKIPVVDPCMAAVRTAVAVVQTTATVAAK